MAWTTALTAAGYGMQAGGGMAAAIAQSNEARVDRDMAKYNAAVAENNAKAVEMKTKFDQIRQRQRAAKIMGSLRAKLGASGAMVSEGAPLMLQAEQAWESELENALIGYEGQTKASQYRSQGALDRYQAKVYKQRSKNALISGGLGAGSTLLSGFAKMNKEGMFE